MKDDQLKIHRVQNSTEPEFAELVRIYSEAHPASERKSVAMLSSMVERPEYLFQVVSQANQVLGFAIVLCFVDSDACLLEYMAVERKWRSRGIGKFLFTELVKLQEISERYLLAEVDSDKAETADKKDRTRRKDFYRRLGCREIEKICYIMPQVSSALPPAMDLLVYRRMLPDSIERTDLRKWLQSCYVQVYGKAESDPRIETMLKDLPAVLRLI
ncbi:MAG: GNAT family N-acetyltransferase [Acidobacteriota bacterium]|nr:GNAT family N-acetyltransferase [Acidobacteriota bacterium]